MRTSSQLLSMKGRHALITGAASGIGKAMALRFAEAGADLLLVDIDEPGLTQTATALAETDSRVTTQVVNLTDKAQIDAFWALPEAELPDTLINNAGSYPMRDYLELDPAFLEKTLRLNLDATLWMCQRINVDLFKTGYHVNTRLALGRWGDPDEVDCVALFLAL